MDNYIVYKHTSPSNKVYIGITCKSAKERWANGKGYSYNSHFQRAIDKYGWTNILHEVLYEHLSKEEACKLEVDLIAKFDSANPDKGYNLTHGGEHNSLNTEVRKLISKKLSGLKRSGESLINIRKSHVALWNSGYSPRWVHKGEDEHIVGAEKLSEFLAQGYEYGRSSKSYRYIHKGEQSKKVLLSDLSKYMELGWEVGRSKKDIDSAISANIRYTRVYQKMKFKSAADLANYLRVNGYPKIVGSTITSLYLKGFNTSSKYFSLEGKISRYENN